MVDIINVGDKVRYIDDSGSRLKQGEIYTVSKVKRRANNHDEDHIFLEGISDDYTFWYARRFELVSSDRVSVTIEGTVKARAAGAATVQLDDGTSVVLPESLVPEDPNLKAFRDLMIAVCERKGWSVTRDNFGEGEHDDTLRALLPQFMEGRGRSA